MEKKRKKKEKESQRRENIDWLDEFISYNCFESFFFLIKLYFINLNV